MRIIGTERIRRFVHRLQQAGLALLARTGYRVPLGTPETATVIILSFRRMQNISDIVRRALMCHFVDRVVVSNNNPEVDLEPWLTVSDPRLELIQQQVRRPPSYRFDLARSYPSDYYIAIDDDVFPSPWQLRRMFAALLATPAAPRGTDGENYHDPTAGRQGTLAMVYRKPWPRRACSLPVDVILQVYLFTKAHLARYFTLIEALGMRNEDLKSSEDVVLSFAGTEPPVADDPGWMYRCPTSADTSIATYLQDGAMSLRNDLFLRLRSLQQVDGKLASKGRA